MEGQSKPIDIEVTLGSNTDHDLLATIKLDLVIGEEVNKFRQSKKLDATNKDVVLCIDFTVEPGREKQFSQYIEKGMDGDEKHLSPLQQLFFRPKSAGKVQVLEFPGIVRAMYMFYGEYLEELDELRGIIEKEHDFQPVLNANLELRGKVTHHKKNRTAAKVQYAKIQAHATLNLKSIFNVIVKLMDMNNELNEQQKLIFQNPLFKTGLSMRKIKLKLGLQSFRKLRRFYKKANKVEEDNQKKTSFPYVTKGLIKDKVNFSLFYQDHYAVTGEVVYHSEDIFMRLLKVYAGFVAKLLDMAHKLQDNQEVSSVTQTNKDIQSEGGNEAKSLGTEKDNKSSRPISAVQKKEKKSNRPISALQKKSTKKKNKQKTKKERRKSQQVSDVGPSETVISADKQESFPGAHQSQQQRVSQADMSEAFKKPKTAKIKLQKSQKLTKQQDKAYESDSDTNQ